MVRSMSRSFRGHLPVLDINTHTTRLYIDHVRVECGQNYSSISPSTSMDEQTNLPPHGQQARITKYSWCYSPETYQATSKQKRESCAVRNVPKLPRAAKTRFAHVII
jgi:hypothetical protein